MLSAAIDKYIFIGINRTFTNDYTIKYSAMERVPTIDDIRHPIVREVLAKHKLPPAVEIVSLADIPAGTGLASSGTFTVGLLRAIYALRREHIPAADFAEEACHIEMNLLGQPIGKQDQYIASFGGLTCLEFASDGRVTTSPLAVTETTLHDLQEHLLMFFTGYSREATEVLADQKRRSEQRDSAMLDNLDQIKSLGLSIKEALERGHTRRFGELMHEHWLKKRERSEGMSNPNIDRWYNAGITSRGPAEVPPRSPCVSS